MIYIYDLILNWSNKRRYEFFEWDNNDEIEYIKKIPIFKISNFDEVVENEFKVGNSFLEKIFNKTEVYGNKTVDRVEYCCVLCNDILTKAIACELDEEGKIIYSSNIYFLDLEDVLGLAKKIKVVKVEGEILNKGEIREDLFLTRKESKKKKILIDDINISYKNKDIYKLKYYYYELFNKECDDVDKIKDMLLNSLNNIYNYKHEKLYNLMKLPIL